jgi:cytochrome P450
VDQRAPICEDLHAMWARLVEPAAVADPYAVYEELRRAGAVFRFGRGREYGVTGLDEGTAFLRDPRAMQPRERRFAVRGAEREAFRLLIDLVRYQMVLLRDPDHARIRKVLQRVFTPRSLEALRTPLRATIAELLDAIDTERFDFVEAFARPLPANVICDLLGIPRADRDRFVAWSQALVEFVGTFRNDRAFLEQTQKIMAEWADYFAVLAADNRGRDTLLGRLLDAEESGEISRIELSANAIFLLAAGHETTTNLLGNGLLALLRQQGQLERLRRERALVPNAVEELLRFDSPLQWVHRECAADMRVGELELPEGSQVHVCLGAANRDPRAFENPNAIDVARPSIPHLSFSSGAYFCLGASLARLEAHEAFGALLDRFPKLELAATPTFKPNPHFRGLEGLEIEVRAR